jgi:hypothetical protein
MTRSAATTVCFLSLLLTVASAWSPQPQPPQPPTTSRRDWFQQTAAVAVTVTTVGVLAAPQVSLAASSSSSTADRLIEELQLSQSKLIDVPQLLQDQEWDKVRTILKTPPVNKLWNLGDSQNTVLQLAKETGNVEFFELKDEVAYNLQTCDQLTYNNVFVYFQPGNGKISIKEPTDAVNKALSLIKDVLAESK